MANDKGKRQMDALKPSVFRRCVVGIKRVAKCIFFLAAGFALILLVGLIPVNNDFQPAKDGVEIAIISNSVHADLILPIRTDDFDWRTVVSDQRFSGDTTRMTHVAIGWGDQGFFIETPTWSDLKLSTAAHALLWPSPTCLHFVYLSPVQIPDQVRSVTISKEQYAKLVQYILNSFETNDPSNQAPIADASYGSQDIFFEANGTYHCLNTCNSWVGRGLQTAGVRTAWLTPLPKTVYLYLPSPEKVQ